MCALSDHEHICPYYSYSLWHIYSVFWCCLLRVVQHTRLTRPNFSSRTLCVHVYISIVHPPPWTYIWLILSVNAPVYQVETLCSELVCVCDFNSGASVAQLCLECVAKSHLSAAFSKLSQILCCVVLFFSKYLSNLQSRSPPLHIHTCVIYSSTIALTVSIFIAGHLQQPTVLHWRSESVRRESGNLGRLLAGGRHCLPHPGPNLAEAGDKGEVYITSIVALRVTKLHVCPYIPAWRFATHVDMYYPSPAVVKAH